MSLASGTLAGAAMWAVLITLFQPHIDPTRLIVSLVFIVATLLMYFNISESDRGIEEGRVMEKPIGATIRREVNRKASPVKPADGLRRVYKSPS